MSSKFSHLSTAIRATGRSNPISINMVTIGGVGDLAMGGGGGAGGGGVNLEIAGGRFAPVGRGMFLGGTSGAGGTTLGRGGGPLIAAEGNPGGGGGTGGLGDER